MAKGFPTIAVIGSRELINIPNWGALPHYAIYEKYLEAIRVCVSPLSIILPSHLATYLRDGGSLDSVLSSIDGVLLPGGGSNIQSARYCVAQHVGQEEPDRDELAITLVSRSVALGIPILGICRGFQEINVALGGTLHPSLKSRPICHRSNPLDPLLIKYSHSHEVNLTERGARLLGVNGNVYPVNSLHGQGIDKLASCLSVDAVAPDGLVEAASHSDEKICIAGVQWHPEWDYQTSILCSAVFERFRAAAYLRMNQRA